MPVSSRPSGITLGPDGAPWFTGRRLNVIGRVFVSPVNVGLPKVAGVPRPDGMLSAGPGVWAGTPPLFTYQWRRCDASGGGCVDIAGATATGLLLGAADTGSTIRVVVTATNGAGSVTAVSAPTGVVAIVLASTAAPSNLTATALSRSQIALG